MTLSSYFQKLNTAFALKSLLFCQLTVSSPALVSHSCLLLAEASNSFYWKEVLIA